jgi:hypothetical protein
LAPAINPNIEGAVHGREVSASAKATPPAEKALPQFGHRIAIDSREGVFIVLRTHADRGTVDVLRVSGMRQIEAGIPLSSVQLLDGQKWSDLCQKIDD